MARPANALGGPPRRRTPHSHVWVMGVLGMAIGAAMMVFLPQLKIAATSMLLFAGFHVVGGAVLLTSAWTMGLRDQVRRLAPPRPGQRMDFGWGPGWMNGLAIAALVTFTAAVVIALQWPRWWPAAFFAVALAMLLLAGNLIMRGFRRMDHVVLPMVDLLRSDHDLVLDAGCGSGRTTVALGRILKSGRVVAVDRFDAGYIDGGGRALIERNIQLAGLAGRVEVETADLTDLPFAQGRFDAAVSTHVYDHLGAAKQKGLEEVFRVLRPGGQFLMAVWVPGLSMFAVANVLSLFLTSRRGWRTMADRAGFLRLDQGMFNNTWFLLMEKPASAPAA